MQETRRVWPTDGPSAGALQWRHLEEHRTVVSNADGQLQVFVFHSSASKEYCQAD